MMESRGHKIPRNKDIETQALSGDVFIGSKAVELGLVDSLHTFVQIYKKEYYDCRIIEFRNKQNLAERLGLNALLENKNISKEDLISIIDELPTHLISNRLYFNSLTP